MNYYSMKTPYMRPELRRYIIEGECPRYTEHGAYKLDDTVRFELLLPHVADPRNVAVYIWRESGGAAHKYEMTKSGEEYSRDIFSVTLTMKEVSQSFGITVGLFYFGFDFYSNVGKTRVIQSQKDGLPEFCFDNRGDGAFALTIYERKYPAPTEWYGGVIYHVFVDRFAKSGKCKPKSYAVMNDDWDNGEPQFPEYPGANVANDMFFGGDLWGVRDKLDYLESLGVTTIYLSPIFDAHSNHKYDTGDFEKVDSMFGGKRALKALITAAEKRGIAVILDGVFNHTGNDSKYFNEYGNYKGLGAYQSEESKYHKWFLFGATRDDFESWWGIKILPRVKSHHPDYINYISGKGGIIDTYTSMGISGWRLDVVDELTDVFVENLAERVHESASVADNKRTPIVIGEVWEDASCKIAYGVRRHYFHGDQLDSVMNYPVRSALIEYLRDGNEEAIMMALHTIWEHYPEEVVHTLMNLLGTHDTARIITALAGDSPEGYTNAQLLKKRMTKEQYVHGQRLVMLGYLINATIPGIPSIYYGDEVGMEGYSDPFNRMPFPWGRENETLLAHFRKVGEIRHAHKVYDDGELYLCRFGIPGFLMFGRGSSDETLYTATNRGADAVTLALVKDEYEVIYTVGDVEVIGDRMVIGVNGGAIISTVPGSRILCN